MVVVVVVVEEEEWTPLGSLRRKRVHHLVNRRNCVSCAVIGHQGITTMLSLVRVAKASSGVASPRMQSISANTAITVRSTCT